MALLAIAGCSAATSDDNQNAAPPVDEGALKPAKPTAYFCSARAAEGEDAFSLPRSFRMRLTDRGLTSTTETSPTEDTIPFSANDARGTLYVQNLAGRGRAGAELRMHADRALRQSAKSGRVAMEMRGPAIDLVKATLPNIVTALDFDCSAIPEKTAVRTTNATCTIAQADLGGVPQSLSVALSTKNVTITHADGKAEGKPIAGRGIDDPMSWEVDYDGFVGIAQDTVDGPTKVRMSKSLLETGTGKLGLLLARGGGFATPYECKATPAR
jgi:hypothetical protein